MGPIGSLALYATLALVVLTIVWSVLAARRTSASLARNVEWATYGMAAALTVAVGALQLALVTLDFSLEYVAEYTSSTLSTFYRVGAMWAGQGGSLLLWAWMASLCAAWIGYGNRRHGWGMSPYTAGVFAVTVGLFTGLCAFLASPFAAAPQELVEGMGLNPLLQDPLQIIHPLALYAGYVLYTVPFAIVVGSLIAGDVSGPWVKIASRWSVLAWIALTVGIVLGARWAYAELGWGGYWAWDPVENASLLPWLTGTILLHTGLTYRGAPRLRLASVIVVMTTYVLVLFGTFLTRSGVVSSVHAFGESNLGTILGAAIAAIVVASGALVVWRLPALRIVDPDRRSHGWLGQLVLLLLLTVITVAVLWGTMFPLFNRVVTGQEIAVTPGFFRVVVTPLALGILGLFAISPLLPGQAVSDRRREAIVRAVVAVLVFGGIMLVSDGANPGVAIVFTLAALSIMTVVHKARPRLRDAYDNDASPTWGAIRASGPYVGHVGLVVMLAAIALNVAYQAQGQGKVALGETATIGDQVVTLQDVRVQEFPDRASFTATVSVLGSDGAVTGSVDSKLEQFNNAEQLHAQVGILSTPMRDVYVVVDEADATPGAEFATLTVYDNPAVVWIWVGGALLALGGILFAIPRRRKVAVSAEEPAQEDELTELLDAAIAAARSGSGARAGASGDPVAELLTQAQTLSASRSGGAASPEDVVAFLEQAKARAATTAHADGGGGPAATPTRPADGAGRRPTGLYVVVGVVAALVIGATAYLLGHSAGSGVPGINGELTSASAVAQPSAAPVDQAAVGDLMQKISADPKDAASLLALGDIYFEAQDWANAQTFYDKVTAVTPDDDSAWVAAGAAAFNGGDSQAALEAWTKATEVAPDNAEAHYDLGFWYLSQTPPQEDKAKAEWERVIAIDPASDLAKTVQSHLDSLGGTAAPSAPAGS